MFGISEICDFFKLAKCHHWFEMIAIPCRFWMFRKFYTFWSLRNVWSLRKSDLSDFWLFEMSYLVFLWRKSVAGWGAAVLRISRRRRPSQTEFDYCSKRRGATIGARIQAWNLNPKRFSYDVVRYCKRRGATFPKLAKFLNVLEFPKNLEAVQVSKFQKMYEVIECSKCLIFILRRK